jgi:hypothetical protein
MCGDAPGVRAFFRMVDVLASNREPGGRACSPFNEYRRDAECNVNRGKSLGGLCNRLDLNQICRHAVHLPVSGNELSQRYQSIPPFLLA